MHLITGKHIPRRTFLRGMGASVALPLLDSMIPAGSSWRRFRADPNFTRLVCVEATRGEEFPGGPVAELEAIGIVRRGLELPLGR